MFSWVGRLFILNRKLQYLAVKMLVTNMTTSFIHKAQISKLGHWINHIVFIRNLWKRHYSYQFCIVSNNIIQNFGEIIYNNYVSNYYCFDTHEINKFVKIIMFQKTIVLWCQSTKGFYLLIISIYNFDYSLAN